jgi:glycerophosphoryl diester phosphodiesterase
MNKVLNIAHRGARSLAPENTLAAAQVALDLGADLWETDVALTADEELICFHDDKLTRTTDAAKKFPKRVDDPFTSFTLDEIKTLDAGSWYEIDDPFGQVAYGEADETALKSFHGLRVPTLREALAFTRDADWRINVELKRLPGTRAEYPVPEKVLDLIEELGLKDRHVLLSSIRHDWLKRARARRPDIETQALVALMPYDPVDFSDGSFDTFNVRVTRTTPEEVRALADVGKRINLYVINETEVMNTYIDAGAAGLITDFPQRMKNLT